MGTGSLTVADGTLPPMAVADDKLPIKMLNDRVLVRIADKAGERKSSGGIVIPATAQVSKRLIWATVVAQGQNVRSCEVGDKVLFSPRGAALRGRGAGRGLRHAARAGAPRGGR